MKNFFSPIIFGLIFLLASCQVSQRRYMKGFYIHHKSSPKTAETIEDITFDRGRGTGNPAANDPVAKNTGNDALKISIVKTSEKPRTTQHEEKKEIKIEVPAHKTKKKENHQACEQINKVREKGTHVMISPSIEWDIDDWLLFFYLIIIVAVACIVLLIVLYPISLLVLFWCFTALAIPFALISAVLMNYSFVDGEDIFPLFPAMLLWTYILPVAAFITWQFFFVLPFSWLLLAAYYFALVLLAAGFVAGLEKLYDKTPRKFLKVLKWGALIVPLVIGAPAFTFLGIQAWLGLAWWLTALVSLFSLAALLLIAAFMIYIIIAPIC